MQLMDLALQQNREMAVRQNLHIPDELNCLHRLDVATSLQKSRVYDYDVNVRLLLSVENLCFRNSSQQTEQPCKEVPVQETLNVTFPIASYIKNQQLFITIFTLPYTFYCLVWCTAVQSCINITFSDYTDTACSRLLKQPIPIMRLIMRTIMNRYFQ